MYKQENSEIMSLYAISPIHAGTGASMGVVDLPIQRERHTHWPHIQSSGVKGAMRHHFEKFKGSLNGSQEIKQLDQLTEKIFGSDKFGDDNASLPGAIAVSDAKILAFPMRSSHSPFVWITCPAVLKRLADDFNITGLSEEMDIPSPGEGETIVINGSSAPGIKILLEDYEVTTISENNFKPEGIAKKMLEKASTLLLVNDATFRYGVSSCTEIRTQIRIDENTGITVKGSLRYEELLPADTLMYVILFYGTTRDTVSPVQAEQLISYMKEEVIRSHIQIGGNETLGCGLFQIEWIKGGQND